MDCGRYQGSGSGWSTMKKKAKYYFAMWCPYCKKWVYAARDLIGSISHRKCGVDVKLSQYKVKKDRIPIKRIEIW